MPDEAGREATYYACSACHSIRMVTQQRLDRERWEALFEWMVSEQGMTPLEAAEREAILDYLARHYGPGETPRRSPRR